MTQNFLVIDPEADFVVLKGLASPAADPPYWRCCMKKAR